MKDHIKRVRLASGLTQDQLGKLLSVSEATICRWEAGRGEPKASQMQKIEALKLKPIKKARISK